MFKRIIGYLMKKWRKKNPATLGFFSIAAIFIFLWGAAAIAVTHERLKGGIENVRGLQGIFRVLGR